MPAFFPGHRWVTGLVLLLLISACATPPAVRQLIESPPQIPAYVELESTPFYPQRKYQCGPAALATVINFYQVETTPEQLLSQVYIPKLKGSLQIEMLAASRHYNRLAIQQDGRLESLLTEVADGNPVLVMQNLGFESYPFWHYAVVIGYDLNKQQIILRSGERKRLLRPFSTFERTWQRAGHWSVVVVPPAIMPMTATEQNYTYAAVAFESTTTAQNGMLAYQSGIKRWPENYILQMGLGNTSYSLRNYAVAETAFRTATQLNRERAEAWNNLAYSLARQGKKFAALKAVNEAIKIAPENTQYRDSEIEISAL